MKKKYLMLASLLVGAFQLTAQSPHFFGVTTNGGGDAAGSIYRTDTNGTNFSLIDTFDIEQNGTSPYNQELVEVNGKMYGVTSQGGDNGNGVFFEFDPSNGNYTVRHNFDDSTGKYPNCYLLLASNGKIYGTSQQGGSNSTGTLFEYNTTTNALVRKVSFGPAVTGRYPSGKLVETSTGIFYGVTTSGGATYEGTIFKYTLSTNTLEKKDEFVSARNGSSPQGGLMKASNGVLYGMAARGGSIGAGTFFQYNLTADSIKMLVDFDGLNGRNGIGTPMQIGGDLYALTNYGHYSTGTGKGVLFKYNISGDSLTKLRTFSSTNPGYYPSGELVPSTAGKFLILMRTGGYNYYAGSIAEYTLATNTVVLKASFNRSINGASPYGNLKKSSVTGKYYGVSGYGGSGDLGTVFEFDPVLDTIINKHNFSPSNNGKSPTGTLVKAPNGKLYGITDLGGLYGAGIIFEVDPVTQNVIKKVDFNSSIGIRPKGGLTLATNGKLYGVTSNGGLGDYGVIFEYNISTNTLTKLKDVYPLGRNPYAALIQATNGKLYGTTLSGGLASGGTIFSYDIALDTLIRHHNFSGTIDGQYLQSKLMQATNGKLYGTARSGGSYGKGTVYEFDIAADSARAIDYFKDTNGSTPYGGLTQAANGNMYGITNRGSTTGSGFGVVYQLDLVADTIIPLHNFNPSVTGYGGYGELLEASNGKMYVTSGSTSNVNRAATINEFDPVAGTFIRKSQLPSGQTYGSLIELVSPNSASVEEKEITRSFLVYPNPATSILTIDTKGERIVGMNIFSVSGQLIQSELKSNNSIDVSNFKSGLYILQVETQNGIALSRFIKK